MPQYRFGCSACEQDYLLWMPRAMRTEPQNCPACGAKLEQLPPSRINVNCDRLDFVTEDITGDPVRIQTKSQLNRLMEENGVRRVSSDEIVRNKRKSVEDIKKLAGVGSLKEDCEKMAQKLGKPLYVRRKAGTKPKGLTYASQT